MRFVSFMKTNVYQAADLFNRVLNYLGIVAAYLISTSTQVFLSAAGQMVEENSRFVRTVTKKGLLSS